MRRFSILAIPFLAVTLLAFVAAPASAGQAKAKTMSASGTVKSVSGSSVVVTGKDKAGKEAEWTFSVDNATTIRGKGAGTKSAQKGGKPSVTDLLGAGDRVTVSFHDMGATKHAAVININSKAMMMKK